MARMSGNMHQPSHIFSLFSLQAYQFTPQSYGHSGSPPQQYDTDMCCDTMVSGCPVAAYVGRLAPPGENVWCNLQKVPAFDGRMLACTTHRPANLALNNAPNFLHPSIALPYLNFHTYPHFQNPSRCPC